ncbi:hypothetical protein [Aquihabitans sp. McL0605]|uniref:hypothetical protein n=1 Tax=Aquihabitans sp. McL0605 TaxID=3415671 RepID=UPI003CF1E920
MIVVTTEHCGGACIVHLGGVLDASDQADVLVEHLIDGAGETPLLIDLTEVHLPSGPRMDELLLRLAAGPAQHTTVLIHPDLETRHDLRAVGHGLPVLPSSDLVLHGRFAPALIARSHLSSGPWNYPRHP